MPNQRIIDCLEKCHRENISPGDLLKRDELGRLASDKSQEVRGLLAKSLVYHQELQEAVPILCRLSMDEDKLVRVEAVDSLSAFACIESFVAMCNAVADEDELVRAYAASGLGFVGKTIDAVKAQNILLGMMDNEESEYVLVNVLAGLYVLGQSKRMEEIISLFECPDYQVKCVVLRILDMIIRPEDRGRFERFVESLKPNQYCVAVADAIRDVSLLSRTGAIIRPG